VIEIEVANLSQDREFTSRWFQVRRSQISTYDLLGIVIFASEKNELVQDIAQRQHGQKSFDRGRGEPERAW